MEFHTLHSLVYIIKWILNRVQDDSRNMSIFHAYDVRGLYPEEITPDVVRKIGAAFVQYTGAKTVAVGRDMRPSGDVLFPALCEGIASAGASIVDVGLVSTPLFYFSTINYPEHDAGIMITASHNPAQYNGLKFLHGDGSPIGGNSGLPEIEKLVEGMSDVDSRLRGNDTVITTKEVMSDYIERLFSLVSTDSIKPLRVVVDAGNGMGGYVAPEVFKKLKTVMTPMYFELDGTFPNHEANPIKPENMKDLQEMVLKVHADVGVAYDGDGDRVGFVDERGDLIGGDITTALLARALLQDHVGARMLYDLRSSKSVRETIQKHGGEAGVTRVGHAFIKKHMKEEDALFAGEVSGHYYFKEFKYLDVSDYALLLMLQMISSDGRPLSHIVAEVRHYSHSGEINFSVENKEIVINRLVDVYKEKAEQYSDMDGVLFDFGDWWFNVRSSNTEPKLRLNLEGKTKELMEEKLEEVIGVINS